MSKYRIVEYKGHGLDRYLPDPGYAVDQHYPDTKAIGHQAIPENGWLTLDWYPSLELAEVKVNQLMNRIVRQPTETFIKVVKEYD